MKTEQFPTKGVYILLGASHLPKKKKKKKHLQNCIRILMALGSKWPVFFIAKTNKQKQQ